MHALTRMVLLPQFRLVLALLSQVRPSFRGMVEVQWDGTLYAVFEQDLQEKERISEDPEFG